MTEDWHAFGIYLHAGLIISAIALVLTYAIHRGIVALRLYRWIWHPALFETGLFALMLKAVLSASSLFFK